MPCPQRACNAVCGILREAGELREQVQEMKKMNFIAGSKANLCQREEREALVRIRVGHVARTAPQGIILKIATGVGLALDLCWL